MSSPSISRRQFLTLGVAVALLPGGGVAGQIQSHRGAYSVDVAVMHDLLSFRLTGAMQGTVDRQAGRYDLTLGGEGSNIANRVESRGRLHEGRWVPVHTTGWLKMGGRESRSDVTYDHARRAVEYRYRGESFFLRRLQVVDDRLTIPAETSVDDAVSALLNYEFGLWTPGADGVYRTSIVRRRRAEGDTAHQVDQASQAELVPLEFRVAPHGTAGKTAVVFDMSRFSSWAKSDRPARIVFGADRRPELITSSLILGSSVTVRFQMLG